MDAAARDEEGSMFSGRHFVHSVIPAARTLASNLSFPDLQEMMAQRTPTIPRVSSGQSDSRHCC